MDYGFVIDNRKCIGCHACSTACKSENEVPLGVNRTWVKYVETGLYPNVARHFQVTRCNHCANPPCVRICPVTAMYQRDDGIVEFDAQACIGCKVCMQACPYDAIYIDPESGTAAKCHYCAHRTDLGLEPACVVVCPEHAIIAGDMNDPHSEISHLLATKNVTVRKPEQGTAPKLFYIHGDEVALYPSATERTPDTFLWADVIPLHPVPSNPIQGLLQAEPALTAQNPRTTSQAVAPTGNGIPLRAPQPQSLSWPGPIQIGSGRMADQMVQVSYNAQHQVPWHWPVPAYLVTKGIGAGLFMMLSLALGLHLAPFDGATTVIISGISLLFVAITAGLLVYDLEKPERFLYTLRRPQWKSWLTRGTFILIGFSIIGALWWLAESVTLAGWIPPELTAWIRPVGIWVGFPLALATAIYTAYLFGQAEGRDLWQSTLLPFHLTLQAFMVGSGAILLLALFSDFPAEWVMLATVIFALSLIVDLFVTLLGEFGMSHASETAARAAHEISHGAYRRYFWYGSIVLGHVLPLLLLLLGWPPTAALAGLCAMVGLYAYEHAFVMAPQDIPNS